MASPDLASVRPILESARSIAVVGFHPDPSRPAHYVPAYLADQGYRVIPLNPKLARDGGGLAGVAALADLAALTEPVDVVNIFRRSEAVAEHLAELLAMQPRPQVVWMQLGIENPAVAAALREVGIVVVEDRCMLADHHALGLRQRR
jgi:uncharacterized protein